MGANSEWVRTLQEFTNRNAGRLTVLEVDGEEIGAQSEERDFPLRGVAYDPRDRRVEIMLGDMASVERHLTHTIDGPTSVDIQTDESGRDRALRVATAEGQTILKLVDHR